MRTECSLQFSLLLAVPWLRRLVAGLSKPRPGLDPKSVSTKLGVNKAALWLAFLRALRFSFVSIAQTMLHTPQYRSTNAPHSSVSLNQCSTLLSIAQPMLHTPQYRSNNAPHSSVSLNQCSILLNIAQPMLHTPQYRSTNAPHSSSTTFNAYQKSKRANTGHFHKSKALNINTNLLHNIYVYCSPLLHVSALNLGHFQGTTSLFDVYSVYGKLYIYNIIIIIIIIIILTYTQVANYAVCVEKACSFLKVAKIDGRNMHE